MFFLFLLCERSKDGKQPVFEKRVDQDMKKQSRQLLFLSIMGWNIKYYVVLIVSFIKRLEQIYTDHEFKRLFRYELQTL